MSQLFYTTPSGWDWNKALPVGNGSLGAMIFGEGNNEHFQLNEDTVWFGRKRDRNNPDAFTHLETIRKMILEGNISGAEQLCKYALSGTPQSQHSYQTLGDVYFDYCGALQKTRDFKRILDLNTAVHTSTITDSETGVVYTAETFVSRHYNCIISQFSTSGEGQLNLAASLQRDCFYEKTEHTEDSLYISGDLGGGGMNFCCGMRLVTDCGHLRGIGEHLVAENATTVTVFLTALTDYRSEDPRRGVEHLLAQASSTCYEQLKSDHIAEYQSYFNRMQFRLAYEKQLDELTTDQRLARIDGEHPDHGLINTYMDYGRYLLICSSRGDCLPANLQGLWNRDYNAAWQSKYTININTEMNYWPAAICGLSDCQLPLFDHILRMLPNGRRTAEKMYGCKGFVAHHNTDLWGDTAPQDICISATYWVMGAAWLCTHIWNHYLYTQDMDFLQKMYPALKESVQFFLDFLIEVDGHYVTCPSLSPENTYIMENGTKGCLTYGCTMDNEILLELFSHFDKAATVLQEKDTDLIGKVRSYREKITPIQVGRHGQIMEWQKDYDEAEPGHRHISHLWALHPAHQITRDGTPELCRAAETTLERRLANGGGHTGWSRAWIMNMYARLWRGQQVYENLLRLFQDSTLPNLLDNHPPFQIDGNFGAAAAIAETLLQSNEERTILLPALPPQWKTGEVKGLCGVGGVVYDLSWKEGSLTTAILHANFDTALLLRYGTVQKRLSLSKGETITLKY